MHSGAWGKKKEKKEEEEEAEENETSPRYLTGPQVLCISVN